MRRRCSPALTMVAACGAGVLGFAPAARAHGPRDEPSEAKPSRPVQLDLFEEERYSIHFQSTMATQAHPSFAAKYSGANSLGSDELSASASCGQRCAR